MEISKSLNEIKNRLDRLIDSRFGVKNQDFHSAYSRFTKHDRSLADDLALMLVLYSDNPEKRTQTIGSILNRKEHNEIHAHDALSHIRHRIKPERLNTVINQLVDYKTASLPNDVTTKNIRFNLRRNYESIVSKLFPDLFPAETGAKTSKEAKREKVTELVLYAEDRRKEKEASGTAGQRVVLFSDQGGRPQQQDSVGANLELGQFIIADGMGGLGQGHKAGIICVEEFLLGAKDNKSMQEIMTSAQARMKDIDPEKKGAGATFASFKIDSNGTITFSQAGDVAIVLIPHEYIKVNQGVKRRYITLTRDEHSETRKNLVTNSIQSDREFMITETRCRYKASEGDIILAGSDGFWKAINADDEKDRAFVCINLLMSKSFEQAKDSIIRVIDRYKKSSAGAKCDNISFILYQESRNFEDKSAIVTPHARN